MSAVKRILRHLVSEKEIQKLKGKKFAAPTLNSNPTGKFELGKYDAGFVILTAGKLFIPKGYTSTALPGDIVKVEVFAHPRGKSPEARVIGIVKRSKHEFVGQFTKIHKVNYVNPESDFLKVPIYVPEGKSKKAVPGQEVAVRIVEWENEYINPVGEIVEIIGDADAASVNILAIARSEGVPLHFPDKVLKEAKAIKPIDFTKNSDNRVDFRSEEIITIDPVNAKDFDDAISFKKLEDGNIQIGVYIADVTAYVKEGSEIDKEAAKRATSVYLINKVLPMLPNKLSEDYCSLRPDEDRAAFCVLIMCTPNGKLLSYKFHEGIIRSKRRFDYQEVQDILDGNKKDKMKSVLSDMNAFAKILRKNRLRHRGVDFYRPEVEFELDENEHPVSVLLKEPLESHRLIEEFMLLANKTAAKHHKQLESKHRQSLPYVYRVHDAPDPEDVDDFRYLAGSLGYTENKGTPGSSEWFSNIMNYFDGSPEQNIIEDVALRSMMKAMYQQKNIGHFGLGFKEYTHFTSPIRRYPDLIVHRLLKKYASSGKLKNVTQLKQRVTRLCNRANDMEIRALTTERKVVKVKKLQFMMNKLGEVYDGVISGVASFGLFIELNDILVDGLVRVRDLGDEYFIYEESNYQLAGERTGKSYKLGDRVKVQVTKVDVTRGHLDLVIVN